MTFTLRVVHETLKEAFGVANPDLAANDVYELEKLAKKVIVRCAKEARDLVRAGPAKLATDLVQNGTALMIAERIEALATEEEK